MTKMAFLSALDRAEMKYQLLDIGGQQIIVTEYGGRIFGPFADDNDCGLFWTSSVFEDDLQLANFIHDRNWNIGGDRIWIAPEIQFSVDDRTHFWETLHTPKDIDPGTYQLSERSHGVTLSSNITLQAANTAHGEISLTLERQIMKAENPLRALHLDLPAVDYIGYEQFLKIEGASTEDATAQYWNLLQVSGPGHIYIPMYYPTAGINYYEPVGDLERVVDNGVILEATGTNRYKTGYKSAYITGRIAYTQRRGDQYILIVKNFPNNPSSEYCEEPPESEGENGFSLHIYNDDGNAGGFTEIECNLQSVGGHCGYAMAADRLSTWIFSGPKADIDTVAHILCGFKDIEF